MMIRVRVILDALQRHVASAIGTHDGDGTYVWFITENDNGRQPYLQDQGAFVASGCLLHIGIGG